MKFFESSGKIPPEKKPSEAVAEILLPFESPMRIGEGIVTVFDGSRREV